MNFVSVQSIRLLIHLPFWYENCEVISHHIISFISLSLSTKAKYSVYRMKLNFPFTKHHNNGGYFSNEYIFIQIEHLTFFVYLSFCFGLFFGFSFVIFVFRFCFCHLNIKMIIKLKCVNKFPIAEICLWFNDRLCKIHILIFDHHWLVIILNFYHFTFVFFWLSAQLTEQSWIGKIYDSNNSMEYKM